MHHDETESLGSLDSQPLINFDSDRENDYVSSVLRRFNRGRAQDDDVYELHDTYLSPMDDAIDIEAVKIGMTQNEPEVEEIVVEPTEFQRERDIQTRIKEEMHMLRSFERENKISESKNKLEAQQKINDEKIAEIQDKRRQQEQLQHEKSYTNWKRNDQYLKRSLERMDTRVANIVDDTTNVDFKRWQLIWKHEPQFINFCFHQLVVSHFHHTNIAESGKETNKLSVTVTLFDRLGGSPLTYKLKNGKQALYDGIGGNSVNWIHDKKKRRYLYGTEPFTMRIDRYVTDLYANQIFDFICPADIDVQPRMIFIIEIYDLATNEVLAWGVFPAVTSNLTLIKSGHFKVPLVRGAVDTRQMNSYEKWNNIRDRFWFGTLYFEIVHNTSIEYLTEAEIKLEHKETVIDHTGGGVITQLGEYDPPPDRSVIWDEKNLERTWFGTNTLTINQNSNNNERIESPIPQDHPLYRQSVELPDETSIWVKKMPLYQKKLVYIRHTLKFDLGLYDIRTLEFWLMILLCIFVLYIRIWPHYFGQWFCISVSNTPMLASVWYPWHVYFDFRVEFHSALFIVGYIICGISFNILTSALMMICVTILQSRYVIHHYLPSIVYRFTFLYACSVILDPILILITDLIFTGFQPLGESFMLARYYEIMEGSPVPGVILTISIYFAFMVCQSFIVYWYVLHIHMNGRLWDLYHRIHAKEYELTRSLPHDCTVPQHVMEEISLQVETEDDIDTDSSLQRRITVLDLKPDLYAFVVLDRLRCLLDACEHDAAWVAMFLELVPGAFEVASTISTNVTRPCYWTQENTHSKNFTITNKKLVVELVMYDHGNDNIAVQESYFMSSVVEQMWLLDDYSEGTLECRMMKCLDHDESLYYQRLARSWKQVLREEYIDPIRKRFKRRHERNTNVIAPTNDDTLVQPIDDQPVVKLEPNIVTFSYQVNEQIHHLASKKRKHRIARCDSCFCIKNNVEERFYREMEQMECMRGELVIVYNVNLSLNQRRILSTYVQTPLSQLCHIPPDIRAQPDITCKRANHCRLDKEDYWIQRGHTVLQDWLRQL